MHDILGDDVDWRDVLGLVVRYTIGALVLVGAVVALQRADRALSPGARGAATGAALIALVVLGEIRRRRPAAAAGGSSSTSAPPPPRGSLPSIHLVEIPYPKQPCAACGHTIRKRHEGDRAVLVAEPGRLRYYCQDCAAPPRSSSP